MRALVVVLLLASCRGDQRSAKPQVKQEPAAAPSGSADPWAKDPWAVAANPDDPPDIGTRHKLADAACPRVTSPYFFRIEKAGKVSHILGTRHVGVPLAKFPPPVHRAIESAKLAVFEVAPGDDSDLPQPEVFLPDALGPELWKRYQVLVGAQTAETLERASPSVAALAMMIMYEDIGATLDIEIEDKVEAAKVPTAGLESSEFQDRLLNKVLDMKMLKASVEQTDGRDELAKESREDLAEYCAGTDTTPGMDDEMRGELLASGYSKAELDQIDEEMIYARNEDWIPKLEKILETDGTFIAVGAAHLIGPRGVVVLLEKRGYKLTRVAK